MRIASLVLFVTIASGCDGSLGPESFLPKKGVEVVVDSAVYHLQTTQYGWSVNVTASVINGSDRDVYLWQDCGYWSVSRPSHDDPALVLGVYGCAFVSSARPAPRLIAAGDRYTETFKLTGELQPQARPAITIENNIGSMLFRYQFTDPLGTKVVPVISLPFEVKSPQ